MLPQIGIDDTLHCERHAHEHGVAALAGHPVRLANQLHLAGGEAARLVGVTHRSIVVEHEEADLLSAMTHENVWLVREHFPVQWAVRLRVLHHMKVAKIRLHQALGESTHDSRLDRVVLSSVMLWVADLRELPLLKGVLERLIGELRLGKVAQRFQIVVLQVHISVVKLSELIVSQLVLDDVKVHAIETLQQLADDTVEILRVVSRHARR